MSDAIDGLAQKSGSVRWTLAEGSLDTDVRVLYTSLAVGARANGEG